MEPWNPQCVFDFSQWDNWGLQVAKRLALALPSDIYLERHPFRQLVAGNHGCVQELEVPSYIREICHRPA
jgi:hypothetical protein